MSEFRSGGLAAAMRCSLLLGAGVLAAPALGQSFGAEVTPVGRVAGPLVQAVALQGDRLPQGVIASVGRAQIDRRGEIGFVATLVQGDRTREGLFAWSGGAVVPLALAGEETGRGPLLVVNSFSEWVWSDGARAVFRGAVDANGNGVFDMGVDPQFLFLADGRRLTPLLRVGDKVDGGTLLSIETFRLNGVGQVAFEALIDRNGDGRFTKGIDTQGVYLLEDGRIRALARTGDRVGDGRINGLAVAGLKFNDRAEVLLKVILERPGEAPARDEALILINRSGIRLLASDNPRAPRVSLLESLLTASLNDRGDVVFAAFVQPFEGRQGALFRVRSGAPAGTVEALVRPGAAGPDESLIQDFFGATLADNGAIAFIGSSRQDPTFVEGDLVTSDACYVLAPEFLYEIARQGNSTPWGIAGAFDPPLLNDRTQAAVLVSVSAPSSETLIGPEGADDAILFWENGMLSGVVGPDDLIPGGRVGADTSLIGLSDVGRLAFGATVTDNLGVSRRGIFVALVSN